MQAKSKRLAANPAQEKTVRHTLWSSLAGIGLLLLGMAAHAAIPASERQVLLNIYAYTDGIDWDPQYQSGWKNAVQGTECTWYGITCDATGSTITGIDLAGVGMYGMLPSLSALTNLQSFDITQTANSGIGPYNSLFGPIPSLAGLSHLQTFKANNTFFSGSLPSLTGLANLADFEVFNCNGLGGPIPSLTGLTSLVRFDVHNNQLTGNIPALAGLSNLAYFRVSDNHLTGVIPSLSGLTNLSFFEVGANPLTGSVPDLAGLPNLQHFRAYGTLMDGNLGKLSDLPQLLEFFVSDSRLTGNLPLLVGAPNLQSLFVDGNRLTGSIPDLSGLPNLTVFAVAGNQLTGSPPQPPSALVANATASSASATLCPNLLTPAANPPSAADLAWDTATATTPWSLKCAPNPKWPSYVMADSSLNPSLVGQPVTFTAMIEGMNPTGTVTFTTQPDAPNNANQITTLCDSVPLVDFIATCTVSNFTGGSSNVVVANYSGDANNEPANNRIGAIFGNVNISTIDQIVNVTVDVAVTANPAQLDQPVDLTATLTGGSEKNTVTFYDGQKPLCANVAERTVQEQQVAHCVITFTTVGVHMLTASENAFGGGMNIPVVENIVAPTPFDADQFALTGSWYNPPTSGQGMELEVFPDYSGAGAGLLYGGWFMYDTSGHPQWLTMAGDMTSAHGSSYSLNVFLNAGGNFNAPPVTQSTADGTATLTFYDCNDSVLTYKLTDGRSGTIPYVRVTAPIGCSDAVPAMTTSPLPANYADVRHSGAWYNPATSGQGLMVDFVPAQTTFYAIWYTYAPQTEGQTGLMGQRWFELWDPNYMPGNLNLDNVQILATGGGIFDTPSAVSETQVGTAQIEFTSCNTMTLKYAFTQGEFAGLNGTINEQAIVPVSGCQ